MKSIIKQIYLYFTKTKKSKILDIVNKTNYKKTKVIRKI